MWQPEAIGVSTRGAPLPVDQAPGFALRAAEQFRSAIWRRVVGVFPSTPLFALMLAMRTSPHEYQQVIADRIAVDKATVTALIHQLERRGLAVRGLDAVDGRRRTVRLSPGADAIIDSVSAQLAALDDELMRPLDASERAEVTDIWRLTSQAGASQSGASARELENLLASPGWLLRRTRQVHSRLWEREVPLLTPPQYATIDVLYLGVPLEVLVTAREASLEESNGARLLNRLTDKGLITRLRDPHDGRRILLDISDAGAAALRACSVGVRLVQEELVSPLSPGSVERFHDLTARVARID